VIVTRFYSAMKLPIYILFFLMPLQLAQAQHHLSYFDFIEDPLKIKKGEEENHFKYALTLLEQDSVVKAYQILWRVRETGALDLKKINNALEATKRKIIHRYNKLLRSSWILSYEGYGGPIRMRDSVRFEKIVISKRKICFYGKKGLTKEYKYSNEIQIDPYFGYVSYLVRYKNLSEEWMYDLEIQAIENAELAIEAKEGPIDGKDVAVYTRIK